jgi:hypothetical protein
MIDYDDKALARAAAIRSQHGIFLGGDDALRVSTWCSASGVSVVTVTGRLITLDGRVTPFDFRHTPNTDRTIASQIFQLGAGWLEHVRVVTNSTPAIGQVFVRVELVRGATGGVTPLAVLLQGHVNAAQLLAWPGSPIGVTFDQRGALRSITGTDPAAGAEISETVPTGARWIVRALAATLITDGTVANREPVLTLDDGTSVLIAVPAAINHAASTTRRYTWTALGQVAAGSFAPDKANPWPEIPLTAGGRVRTATTGIQAGDNWGAPQLLVEEWLEGAA